MFQVEMNMQKKYPSEFDDLKEYWVYCEKNKLPYIEVKYHSEKYSIIFCDITNFDIDLQKISEKLKDFYMSYLNFLRLTDPIFDDYKDQYYFFQFLVKKEHSFELTNNLFEFLVCEL